MTHVHPHWKWLRRRCYVEANKIFFRTGVHAFFYMPNNKVDHYMVRVVASKNGKALFDHDMRIKDIENGTLLTLLLLVAGDG